MKATPAAEIGSEQKQINSHQIDVHGHYDAGKYLYATSHSLDAST